MAKDRKKIKRTTIIILSGITVCSAALFKLVPPAAKAAFGFGGIDLSSEPEYYAGDNTEDFFGILGSGKVKAEQENDEQQESPEEDFKGDKGPKPYPTEWDIDEDTTVYPYTFERRSGNKYISLESGGQIMNETEISNSILIDESENEPDFTIETDGTPQVLIMHTHTTESFEPFVRESFDSSFNYRTTDPSKNVVMIGDSIAKQLENAGIGVIHDSTIHDYPSYNGSYERSAETVKGILAENPTIKVVLDIHRDAVGSSDSIMQPTVDIDGKQAAQIMIICGCDDGTLDMPDYIKNFRFACKMQNGFANDYPGLARPMMFDYRKYNQDLTTGSLLIEVGSHGNTLSQVEYSGELIGRSLAKTLKGLQ